MAGTILLGIDVESASAASLGYTRYGVELFHSLDVPVTFYITGRTLEKYPDQFAILEQDPLIDLQCHTYDHLLLKTVFMDLPDGIKGHDDNRQYLNRGVTLEQIDDDLDRCVRLSEQVLGRRPLGFTGPWGYYRGLQDRPDILEIVARHGLHCLRTFARDERDCQPVPIEWQPFFYELQGFNDVLEILIHGYQDDFYWRMFARPGPTDSYDGYLKTMARRIADEDLVWSVASHDHSCATREGFEHKGSWLRSFITYAKGIGIRFLSAEGYYQEALGARQAQQATSGMV